MISQDDIMTAVRTFLLAVLPEGIEVVQGQSNRVPAPDTSDHIVMTPSSRTALSTPRHVESESTGEILVARSTGVGVQIDVYGPNSAEHAQIVATLLRDAYGCALLEQLADVQTLYCDTPNQMPLVNGEQQYEDRWMIAATFQASPVVSTPMQFADSVAVTISLVD